MNDAAEVDSSLKSVNFSCEFASCRVWLPRPLLKNHLADKQFSERLYKQLVPEIPLAFT